MTSQFNNLFGINSNQGKEFSLLILSSWAIYFLGIILNKNLVKGQIAITFYFCWVCSFYLSEVFLKEEVIVSEKNIYNTINLFVILYVISSYVIFSIFKIVGTSLFYVVLSTCLYIFLLLLCLKRPLKNLSVFSALRNINIKQFIQKKFTFFLIVGFLLSFYFAFLKLNLFRDSESQPFNHSYFFPFFVAIILILFLWELIIYLDPIREKFIQPHVVLIFLIKFYSIFLGGYYKYLNSFWIFGHTNVLSTGFSSNISGSLWYFEWPGMFLFTLPFYQIIEKPFLTILFMELIFFGFIYFHVNYLLELFEIAENKRGVYQILFFSLQNITIWYYTSSFFGFILYFFLINFSLNYLKYHSTFDLKFYKTPIFIYFIILFSMIVSHVGTLFFTILNVIGIVVGLIVFNGKKPQPKKIILPLATVILVGIFSLIYVFGIEFLVNQLVGIFDFNRIQNRLIPYFSTHYRVYLQFVLFFTILLFFFRFVIENQIEVRKLTSRSIRNKFTSISSLAAIIILITDLIAIFITDYGGSEFIEIRARIYVFSLIPIFVGILLGTKKDVSRVLVFLTLVSLLIHIPVFMSYDVNRVELEDLAFTEEVIHEITNNSSHQIYIISTRNNPVTVFISKNIQFLKIDPSELKQNGFLNTTILENLIDNLVHYNFTILAFWYHSDSRSLSTSNFETYFNNPSLVYEIIMYLTGQEEWSIFAQSRLGSTVYIRNSK